MKLECIICLEYKFYVSKTSCNHNLCIDCLFKIRQMYCPMCRKDLSNELPNIVKDNIIRNIEKNNNNITTSINLNDNYEFPPL